MYNRQKANYSTVEKWFAGVSFIAVLYFSFSLEQNKAVKLQEVVFIRSSIVPLTSSHPDPANNGKLVHLSEVMRTDDILSDEMFGVKDNAIKLNRIVEMYQWQQVQYVKTNSSKSRGVEYEYTYNLVWSPDVISSKSFINQTGHENPTSPYPSQFYIAPKVTMGGFEISQRYYDKIQNFDVYPLTQKNMNAADPKIKSSYKIIGNQYVNGDLNNPKLGDIKITFQVAKPMMITIVGEQNDEIIEAYQKDGHDIALLYPDQKSIPDILKIEEQRAVTNSFGPVTHIWVVIVMLVTLNMFYLPLLKLASCIPFIGRFIKPASIIQYPEFTSRFLIVQSFYITTISIAWLPLKPVESYTAIIASVAISLLGFTAMEAYRRYKKTSKQKKADTDESEDLSNKTPKDGNFS